MEPILNIAKNAARLAGEVILWHRDKLNTLTVTEKSLHDFVSEVDVLAEKQIIETIHKAYPDHGILAEESGETRGKDEVTWIIDPLDGTSNYLHGFPHCAVSIGIRVNNRIEHALIYDPFRRELYSASRGRGAYLEDRRMRVSNQLKLDGSIIACSYPQHRKKNREKYDNLLIKLMNTTQSVRRLGSAALDLAFVAAGRLDGCVQGSMNIWDTAAGTLLVKEAGGFVSDFSAGEDYFATGELIAANPKIFKNLLLTVAHRPPAPA